MEPWGAGSLPRGWWVGLLQYSAIHCYVHLRHWYCWRSRCPGSLSVCLLLICVSVHFHRFLFQVLCFFSFFVLFLQVQQSVIHRVFLFVSILLFYFSPFCSACQFYTVITDTTLKILFHYTSSSCRLLVGCVLHGLPVILCHIMQSPKRLLKYTSVNRNKQIQMCQIVVNSSIM